MTVVVFVLVTWIELSFHAPPMMTVGEGPMPRTVPVMFTSYAGMDIGRDNGGVVDLDYEPKAPYAFTGTVKKVTFDLKPESLDDAKALHQHHGVQAVADGTAG